MKSGFNLRGMRAVALAWIASSGLVHYIHQAVIPSICDKSDRA